MWKNSLIIGIILVAIAGYFFWKREQNAPQVAPNAVVSGEAPRHENTTEPPEKAAEINKVSRVKKMLNLIYTEEERASPDLQEWMQLLESPEFTAFLETNPTSLTDFYDFYESQGIKTDKSKVRALFQDTLTEHFPAKTAVDLEPQMRQELSNIFTESDIAFQQAVQDFVDEEQNIAWVMEYFDGDFHEFGKWAVTVSENPVPLPTDTSTIVENNEMFIPTETEGDFPDAPTLSEASQDPQDSERMSEEPPSVPKDPLPTLKDMENLLKSDAELEAEFLKLLEQSFPAASKLPTIVELEKNLRQRFSPQRFNTAMQTLDRYGPEEGLRRLKESDPEVATHFERLIQGGQENQ